MLNYYSGGSDGTDGPSTSQRTGASPGWTLAAEGQITRDDIRTCKDMAVRNVRVPQSVIQVRAGARMPACTQVCMPACVYASARVWGWGLVCGGPPAPAPLTPVPCRRQLP